MEKRILSLASIAIVTIMLLCSCGEKKPVGSSANNDSTMVVNTDSLEKVTIEDIHITEVIDTTTVAE